MGQPFWNLLNSEGVLLNSQKEKEAGVGGLKTFL